MTVAACPGCAAAPAAVAIAADENAPTHHLVLPGIHCAACISTVERTLLAQPGIAHARVNLTRKRAAITADPGMDPSPWIEALAKAGFEAHEADEADRPTDDDLLIHLGVAGFAMMNVMLLSVAVWSGADGATRDFLHWVSAAIALPAATFSAQPFFKSAWRALTAGRLNMDVPISLAIILACGMSLYEVTHGGHHAWFDAALSLTFFLLAGRVLDQRMRRAARSAADNLVALEPSRVTVVEDGLRLSRPIAEVAIGDTLWIAAGGRVPVDAVLLGKPASVDRSAITGESDPITCSENDDLVAGDILLDGPHELRATRVGEDTTLRRIAQLVSTAEATRGHFVSLADRAAAVYTPAVHILSAAAFAGWFMTTGDIRMALNVAIATLIITCPCALGLAVPAVAVSATGRLYREGLLVKSDTALERLATIDTVVFDKTGTLTERRLYAPRETTAYHRSILRALADASDHPLSKGIAASMADVEPAELEQITESAGIGISAMASGQPVFLGRDRQDDQSTVLQIGPTQYRLQGIEVPLPGAKEVIATLRDRKIPVFLLTGDSKANAARIAAQLNIENVFFETLPEQKAEIIEQLRAEGHRVLMVGDGLNDTAALSVADASIAPCTALSVSRNAADVNIVSGDISKLTRVIDLSRNARRRMLENFFLAAVYNAIAIPIAMSGFATPLAAAIAMSTSSITVVLNSQRGMTS